MVDVSLDLVPLARFKIKLHLVATHADMAAALGFLSQGQKAFSPIVFAGGAVIAAGVGNAIAYEGTTLSTMKFPMIAYGFWQLSFLSLLCW